MQLQSSAAAADLRRPLWIALLVAASVAFSLGFACATPFAAFAAVAALTMPRRDALLLVGLVWFANQAVGFGVLHYPWTADCLAWGLGLGAVAVAATFGAEWAAKRFSGLSEPLVWAAAFFAAFALYEGLLFAASVTFRSGVEDYTAAIVGRIFAVNAAAFLGLLVANRLGVATGLALAPAPRLAQHGSRN